MVNNFTFQRCSLEDLQVLQSLSITTFSTAYSSKNTPENMQKYLLDAFNIKRLTKELSNPQTQFIFLKANNEVLGYFKVNENEAQSDFQTKDSLELERIYVVPEQQGNGYGKVILEETIRIAKDKGKTKVWLGVWQKNPDAVRFYQKNGFKIVGSHDFIFVDEAQVDWVMEKAI